MAAFQTYYSVSAKMAQDLGLQDPSSLELYNDYEKSRRRTTWAGVLQLHSIYSRRAFFVHSFGADIHTDHLVHLVR